MIDVTVDSGWYEPTNENLTSDQQVAQELPDD